MDRATGEMEKRERLLPFLILATLVLFHILNNWMWLSTNVVIVGWDRPRHLIESLRYNDILKTFNYPSFFEAFTLSGYYPPLFHLLIVAFYKLFGLSADVAAMVNSLYLAILLPSTYMIGRKVWGWKEGLLAAFLVSTFPMIYALSRYTYIEFALTSMVTLSICLLLMSEGFIHKGYSLLFGLSLGLGMLTKWTYTLFVLPSLILMVARLPLRRWLRDLRLTLDRRWAGLSTALGLGLALLWYLPVRERVGELPLAHWLLPISWLLLSGVIYLLSRGASQKVNLLSTLWLAGTVAATWCLSRIDFIQHTFLIAWGRPERREWGFSYYLDHLVNEQLSPFYVGLLALLFLGFLVSAWRRKTFSSLFEPFKGDMALFLLWLLIPYLVLSFRASSIDSRFLMPILPALALLIARGLAMIPYRNLQRAITLLVVLVALGQFFALSCDGLGWLRNAAVIEMPGDGSFNLFAHGHQNQLPNSGQTEAGYWIVPDLLEYVRRDSGGEKTELGLLVNCAQIHEEHFLYLIYSDYPEIRLRELARNWTGRPVYSQLFELEYFALSTYHPAHRFNEESREVIDTILESPPPLLREAFQLAQEYPLPDGNVVYLYRRRYPRSQVYPTGDYPALGEALLERATAGDALILDPSEEVNLLGPYYRGEATLYLPSEKRSSDEIKATLGRVITDQGRVFAVFGEESTGFAEGWLNEQGYRAWEGWYGGTRLVVYGTSLGIEEIELEPLGAKFGEGLRLLGYRLYDSQVEPGGMIRLTLRWQAKERIGQDYKVFLHLLDGEGRIVAQRDSEPVGGSRPTSGWETGEEISDNCGIMLPRALSSGEYQLVVGMYDPTSGERLPVYGRDGERLPGDRVLLGAVEVTR